jgi:hypothetical protein
MFALLSVIVVLVPRLPPVSFVLDTTAPSVSEPLIAVAAAGLNESKSAADKAEMAKG